MNENNCKNSTFRQGSLDQNDKLSIQAFVCLGQCFYSISSQQTPTLVLTYPLVGQAPNIRIALKQYTRVFAQLPRVSYVVALFWCRPYVNAYNAIAARAPSNALTHSRTDANDFTRYLLVQTHDRIRYL